MTNTGKSIRLERIINRNTGKTIIVPMDHGAGEGPISGLNNMGDIVDKVATGGANAVLGHVVLPLRGHRTHGKDIGLIMHLSVSTCVNPLDKNNKVLVSTVERAVKMGADGVSVHINIGSKTESEQIKNLGEVSEKCAEWGMPLLAMMYPRGEGLTKDEKSPEMVKLAARIGAELGADIVKTYYTGNTESMKDVVKGCPVPVVIAGGSKLSDEDNLKAIKGAMDAGCAGISIGRNVFQNSNPEKFIAAASKIIHGGFSYEDAICFLKS